MITNLLLDPNHISREMAPFLVIINSGENFLILNEIEKESAYLKIQYYPLGGIESVEVIPESDIEKYIKDNDRCLVHFLPLYEHNTKKYYFNHNINLARLDLGGKSSFKKRGEFNFGFLKDDQEGASVTSEVSISGAPIYIFKRNKGGFYCFFLETISEETRGGFIQYKKIKFRDTFELSPAVKYHKILKTMKFSGGGGAPFYPYKEGSIVATEIPSYIYNKEEDEDSTTETTIEIVPLGIYDNNLHTFLYGFSSKNNFMYLGGKMKQEVLEKFRQDIYGGGGN